MKVISLFDGMSCAQIALNNLGVRPVRYIASEIDRYAINVTFRNFPDTMQVGDVVDFEGYHKPDLLIAGSPCQGFSFAGKQLNFNDHRSKLFFEFVRIKNSSKPKYFLLENVYMKKEYQDVISNFLEVEPIEINSNLVSAQNRRRLYWTNIPNVRKPDDQKIMLKDILEYGEPFSYSSSGRGNGKIEYRISETDKAHCLTASGYSNRSFTGVIYKLNNNKRHKKISENEVGYRPHMDDKKCTGISELGRILKISADKTRTLTASHVPKIALNNDISDLHYRKLTPIECERLQTVPDNYTAGVSDTQRYKMLGNGFTVKVIEHILKGIV